MTKCRVSIDRNMLHFGAVLFSSFLVTCKTPKSSEASLNSGPITAPAAVYGTGDSLCALPPVVLVDDLTDCSQLSHSATASSYSYSVNGTCYKKITDLSHACIFAQGSLPRTAILFGDDDIGCAFSPAAAVTERTDCSKLSNSDWSFSYSVQGDCIKRVTQLSSACSFVQASLENSHISIMDVKSAISKNRTEFSAYNSDDTAVNQCESAGAAAGWTKTMQTYYCTFPISDPEIRTCFTGSVQGRGGITKRSYNDAYKFCANNYSGKPMEWVQKNQDAVFRAVMLERRF